MVEALFHKLNQISQDANRCLRFEPTSKLYFTCLPQDNAKVSIFTVATSPAAYQLALLQQAGSLPRLLSNRTAQVASDSRLLQRSAFGSNASDPSS